MHPRPRTDLLGSLHTRSSEKFGCSPPPIRRVVAVLTRPNSLEQNGASARRLPGATTLGFYYSTLVYGGKKAKVADHLEAVLAEEARSLDALESNSSCAL
jgi:transcriptional regulator of heat shock response